jgi:hypothetical protein
VRRHYGTQRRDLRLERELAAELDHSSQALDQRLVAAESSPSQRAARREQAVVLAEMRGETNTENLHFVRPIGFLFTSVTLGVLIIANAEKGQE